MKSALLKRLYLWDKLSNSNKGVSIKLLIILFSLLITMSANATSVEAIVAKIECSEELHYSHGKVKYFSLLIDIKPKKSSAFRSTDNYYFHINRDSSNQRVEAILAMPRNLIPGDKRSGFTSVKVKEIRAREPVQSLSITYGSLMHTSDSGPFVMSYSESKVTCDFRPLFWN